MRTVGLKPSFSPVAQAWALRADPGGVGTLLRPVLLPIPLSATLRYLPSLVRFLRDSTPTALFAATPYMNAEAVLARRLAGVAFRLLLTEHNDLSRGHSFGSGARGRQLSRLCRRTYPQADAIVTVPRPFAAFWTTLPTRTCSVLGPETSRRNGLWPVTSRSSWAQSRSSANAGSRSTIGPGTACQQRGQVPRLPRSQPHHISRRETSRGARGARRAPGRVPHLPGFLAR